MSEPLGSGIELRGLTKGFGGGAVLDHVDMSVAKGEFVALLGPSGSGKTTLLRIIAGLEQADAGAVVIAGSEMGGVAPNRRGIGFVFQSYALFRHMSVAANIGFGLRVRPRATRPPRVEIARRVAELLDLIQLPDVGGRRPDQLSGGQRQRVALARALAIEPQVLLLDEPFGALDTQVRKDLRRWLRGLHDRLGMTTLFVTHDQNEAMELADRVAVMQSGRLAQMATPRDLYAMPATANVFAFLGDSLAFPCQTTGGTAHFADGLPPLPSACADGPALAMVRPGDVGLAADGPATRVSVHESGATKRVELRLGGRLLELSLALDQVVPAPGSACTLDLGRAIIYPDLRSEPR